MTLVSMCGIVRDDGRDCSGHVNPDLPFNLCNEHLKAAFEWYRMNIYSATVVRDVCPACGEREMRAGVVGKSCMVCGYQTPDFTGASPATGDDDVQRAVQPSTEVEVVYYIQFGDRIKIGTTRNLRQRLASVTHDHVLALERGGVTQECRRHAQFSTARLKGEWFSASPELLVHIQTIARPIGWEKQLRELEGKPW